MSRRTPDAADARGLGAQGAPPRGAFDLVVSDIDGTLLDSGNRLTPAVVRAIERVCQAGLRVCLASGRSGILLEPIRRNLGLTTPFIACGGAYAADPERGAVILDAPIPQESARRGP